ncbi:hypothetical protein [Heyndrickxia acidicola]|uniref:Uncharacterized protein n=1 Tax=Heyndrickxia acidicola TaxID=209389 RepID=A0ABU6MGT7_9BACI|nr:hypothetical protein [Heyndrickxia acidicola]MED1203705.1 hypothetical protein [Heyndrickxia acidicola]
MEHAPIIQLDPEVRNESKLIEVKGTRLLRDQRVYGDPAGACDEEAPQPPRGKRVLAA